MIRNSETVQEVTAISDSSPGWLRRPKQKPGRREIIFYLFSLPYCLIQKYVLPLSIVKTLNKKTDYANR